MNHILKKPLASDDVEKMDKQKIHAYLLENEIKIPKNWVQLTISQQRDFLKTLIEKGLDQK